MMTLTTTALHRFFKQISADHAWAAMLGSSAEPTPLNQWCILGVGARQTAILQDHQLQINDQTEACTSAQTLFERLDAMRQRAQVWPTQTADRPLRGGLFGAFSYEFYRWCDAGFLPKEGKQAKPSEWPEAVLCEFEDWLFIHLETGALTVLTNALEREARYHQHWLRCQTLTETPKPPQAPLAPEEYLASFAASFTPQSFETAVEQLKQDISNGEIYQANLSLQLKKRVQLDPYALFERLCHRNPSPFAGFFKWPGGLIISNSPERLVQVDANNIIQTRPIAGTRGRGQTPEEDAQIGQTLLGNEKERAEHLMLVDLARNDLGRLCRAGSVRANDLLVLERYSHVTHLVSNVRGNLKETVTPWGVLAALFPGGTITGCPKIRCVEILRRMEPVSRAFYTGSMGYIDAASSALDLNILIRSVFLQKTETPLVYNAAVHIGAGIVHDAVGAYEHRECLRKAEAILSELYALESQAMISSASLQP